MERYEVFANRNKGFKTDVLQYDSMSAELRTQIFFIFRDALRLGNTYHLEISEFAENFNYIHDFLCRELGVTSIYDSPYINQLDSAEECEECLMHSGNMDILLSLIELCIISISRLRNNLKSIFRFRYEEIGLIMDQDDAIEELNLRFRRAGFGYEFSNGMLIRKDSELLYQEAVKPALHLLQDEDFGGALTEFLKAYKHLRKGDYEDSISNAGKAFESTMKTIISRLNIDATGNENADKLIKILVENEVIPGFLQSSLQGLATVRNKLGSHGKAEEYVEAPLQFVHYALHLCGANIVMLIEAYRDFKLLGVKAPEQM